MVQDEQNTEEVHSRHDHRIRRDPGPERLLVLGSDLAQEIQVRDKGGVLLVIRIGLVDEQFQLLDFDVEVAGWFGHETSFLSGSL